MRISWGGRAAREIDHELLWLGVSLFSAVAATVWFALGLPWPHCAFLSLTGYPCVTCGATRAAIEFFHGHIWSALKWNPLACIVFGGLVVFDVYAAIVLATGAPRCRIAKTTSREKILARASAVTLLALNWIYLLAHTRNFCLR